MENAIKNNTKIRTKSIVEKIPYENQMAETSARLSDLGDVELYKLCQEYGANARLWRKKFGSLLPEVARRELHRKYGFCSIYEFAAKLGGMSRESVSEVLRVSKLLEDKPILQSQLKTFGWSKLRVVATVATPETDKMWAEKVAVLPKSSLETYIKDVKKQSSESVNSLPGEALDKQAESGFTILNLKVDAETEFKLRKFKLKLEKEKKRALTFNEVLKEMLERLEEAEGTRETVRRARRALSVQIAVRSTRHIPATIKRELQSKYNGKCVFPGCNKPSEVLHHTERWAIVKNHERIAPLCEEHHKISHAGLIENERAAPETWRIAGAPDEYARNYEADRKFLKSISF